MGIIFYVVVTTLAIKLELKTEEQRKGFFL